MKRVISLVLILAMCLGLCACGKKSPIVGTWHTCIMGAKLTYVFKSNGTYTFASDGTVHMEEKGKYTISKDETSITFNTEGKESTAKLSIDQCMMYIGTTRYGRSYSATEKADVLKDVLGSWKHTTKSGVTLEINKDGTCVLTTTTGTETEVYIYDPNMRNVYLPDEDILFKLEETSDGVRLNATNKTGMTFKR